MAPTIAVCSLGGAPGVTMVAVALASMWPHPVPTLVVEADPKGGDLATWRNASTKPGLIGLAAAARSVDPPASMNGSQPSSAAAVDLWQHTQTLPGGLRMCPAPTPAHQSHSAVSLLAHHPHVLHPSGDAVSVVDLGRLTPRSPATHLAAAPAVNSVVLVCRDDEAELKRVQDSLVGLRPIVDRAGLVVVGHARTRDREITEAIDLPLWGRIPFDLDGAALVRGHHRVSQQRRARFLRMRPTHQQEQPPLMRAANNLGQRLSNTPITGKGPHHDRAPLTRSDHDGPDTQFRVIPGAAPGPTR